MKPTLFSHQDMTGWPFADYVSFLLAATLLVPSLGAASDGSPALPAGPVYAVYGPASSIDPLPVGVERLGQGPEGSLLVRGPVTAVESLAMRGLELVRLDAPWGQGTVPERHESPPIPPAPRAWNPAIAQLLLAMSSADLRANIQRLQDFQTRYSYSDSCIAAAHYLRDRFQALGLATVLFPFTYNGYTINNVIAEKPGSERPDEIYIICSHYDSITNQPWTNAPGADDNGSGTAAVLEAARVLAAVPFEATIRFIAFAGEEQGLIGSRRYLEEHVVPLGEDVRGVFNLDMIAYVHPSYPEWDANWYADIPVSGALGDFVGQCVLDYTTCVPHLVLGAEPTYGSDHYWFANYGYPAVFDIDAQFPSAPDWDPYYHSINDRLSTLDTDYATEMARGAVAALATLAVPMGVVQVEPAAVLPHVAVGPNPFRSWMAFDVGAATVEVRVTDAAGRVVDKLNGNGRLTWNGCDQSGRDVPAGVYFYTLRTSDQEVSGRIVRIR